MTVVGNIMPFVAMVTCVYHGGLKYHQEPGEDPLPIVPSWVFFLGIFSIQWFSWFDCMDGARARRLKAGSPIGRIVDEAGDLMIYTNIAVIVGYIVKVPPGILCMSYA